MTSSARRAQAAIAKDVAVCGIASPGSHLFGGVRLCERGRDGRAHGGPRSARGAAEVPVIVDPKVEHFGFYKGVTVITPNHLEATQAAGLHGDGDQTIQEAGETIRQRLGCQAVLVTRGERGMSLFEGNKDSWHIPTQARQVYDVTGAGDTVVGTLALALSIGASMREAAMLANHAAGIVVGMVGTATVSTKQLSEALGE